MNFRRILNTLWLLPGWFAPHKKARSFFNRLRGVSIGKDVEIGYFVIIDNELPHLVEIGDHATIVARTTIIAHDHAFGYSKNRLNKSDSIGKVTVGHHAFIGLGAVIMPGITVGNHAIVGANSVVIADVEDHDVVGGIPARSLLRK